MRSLAASSAATSDCLSGHSAAMLCHMAHAGPHCCVPLAPCLLERKIESALTTPRNRLHLLRLKFEHVMVGSKVGIHQALFLSIVCGVGRQGSILCLDVAARLCRRLRCHSLWCLAPVRFEVRLELHA